MAKKPSILRIHELQWCLLVILMLPFLLFAQGSIEVDGTVRDKDSNRKLADVQVEVLRNGQPYDAVSTLSSGKYSLSLEHGTDYELRFSYGDLSPRKVELQTSSIPEAFRERPFYLTVEMSMFEIPPGFDESLLDEPIGKVAFDADKEQLSWDLPYTAQMQSRINDALEDASDGGGEAEASNKEYDEHMRKAEVEFGRGRWAQSINWIDRALAVLPGDQRAEAMLAEAQENMLAAEEEAEARREFEGQMREGKMAMRKEDWSTAKGAFETASALFPDEQEPLDLLAEIQAATAASEDSGEDEAYGSAMAEGQEAFGRQAWDEAVAAFETASDLKPAEREPKDKLAEIRRQRKSEDDLAAENERRLKEYEELIERADRNFDSQDFVRAKAIYEQASDVMPDEVYPRMRAQESESRIVQLGEPDSEVVADDRQDSNEALSRAYEDEVRKGDEAFDAEDWATAEAAYTAALELRPDERYPKNRLRRLASMQNEDTAEVIDLGLDRDALIAENEANAQALAEQTAAMELEQQQILEEERLAAIESESRKTEQKKLAIEKGLDRSRNYVLALQNEEEDDAEAYYRDALESEIRARGLAVYARSEQQNELSEVWLSNSDTRRQSAYADVREEEESHEAIEASLSVYRTERVADLELQTTRYDEQAQDWEATGNAGRRDRFIALTRKDKENRKSLADRTKRYAVFVDSLDRMLSAYADFNRDLRLASVDARIMRFEEIERTAAKNRRVGEGEAIRRQGRWSDIQAVSREDTQAKVFAAGEASIRSAAALRKAESKEAGSPPTPEDYIEVPAKEGIRQGVEERSYEEGNALIIERTVRIENEVNVYRKTVAKHGVYYFKNNHSISRDIWILETFEITD